MPATMDTPAKLAKARKAPPIGYPPVVSTAQTAVEDFAIFVNGKTYLIGPLIEGDPEEQATIDGTATITIAVRDPKGELAPLLADEGTILRDGVSMVVDGDTYMIQSVTVDETTGTLVTMVFQDLVSWQLGLFSTFVAFQRSKYTRAEAALKLVDEASKAPLPPLKHYIPELTDAQRVAAAGTPVKKSTKQGTGADATSFKVKGVDATAAQRANIDAILGECKAGGASGLVMVAAIMAGTQESSILTTATVISQNGPQVGIFQQDSDWGPLTGRRDAALSTSYFLNGWKRVFGSVKAAPGDLASDIEKVQISGLVPQATYGQWKLEAQQTVTAWLGSSPSSASASVDQPAEFTRGTKDSNGRVTSKESSWQASGEWAQVVNWRRWAQHNTFFFISDEELRQQAVGLQIVGNEAWLLSRPAYSWNPDRAVQQVTIRVLKKRWGLDIGACVIVGNTVGPAAGDTGRFLVTGTDGYRQNPELTVTLSRPTTKKPEPVSTTTTKASGKLPAAGQSTLFLACKAISQQPHPYVYGGGHGPKLASLTDPTEGLDCSSSTSLALFRAGLFDGQYALVSGEFAMSYGQEGPGKEFTVMANDGHVWIKFENGTGGQYDRFDTVWGPSGQGKNNPWQNEHGPKLRVGLGADGGTFIQRHWPGH